MDDDAFLSALQETERSRGDGSAPALELLAWSFRYRYLDRGILLFRYLALAGGPQARLQSLLSMTTTEQGLALASFGMLRSFLDFPSLLSPSYSRDGVLKLVAKFLTEHAPQQKWVALFQEGVGDSWSNDLFSVAVFLSEVIGKRTSNQNPAGIKALSTILTAHPSYMRERYEQCLLLFMNLLDVSPDEDDMLNRPIFADIAFHEYIKDLLVVFIDAASKEGNHDPVSDLIERIKSRLSFSDSTSLHRAMNLGVVLGKMMRLPDGLAVLEDSNSPLSNQRNKKDLFSSIYSLFLKSGESMVQSMENILNAMPGNNDIPSFLDEPNPNNFL